MYQTNSTQLNKIERRKSRIFPENKEQVEEKRQDTATPKTGEKLIVEMINKESEDKSVQENSNESLTDSTQPNMSERRSSRAIAQKKEEVEERKLEPETPKRESKNGGKGKKSSRIRDESSVKASEEDQLMVDDFFSQFICISFWPLFLFSFFHCYSLFHCCELKIDGFFSTGE